VVTLAGLVVDNSNLASCFGAEGVLGGSISYTTGGEGCDGGRFTIGGSLDLVKGPIEGAVQGTSSGMCRNTGCSAGGVEVAGPGGDKGGNQT
jgi:hypothetical protein